MTILVRPSLRSTAATIAVIVCVDAAQPAKAVSDFTSHRLGYPHETIYRPDCAQHVLSDCVPRCRRPDETKIIIYGACELGSLR